jgi:hypothetical protein
VLFEDRDPIHVATLIDAIVSNADLQDRIVDGQLAAVDRLRSKDFAGTLLGFVDRLLTSPRRPAPHVAFDFWGPVRRRAGVGGAPMYRPLSFRLSLWSLRQLRSRNLEFRMRTNSKFRIQNSEFL